MPPQLDDLLARVDRCSTQAHELSKQFHELREQIRQAIAIAQLDPEMSLTRARKVLEYVVRDIYDDALKPKRAGTQPLEGLVQTLVREGHFPRRLAAYADLVRGLGIVGTHEHDKEVNSQDVLNSLTNLMPIVEWYLEQRPPHDAAAAMLRTAPTGEATANPPASGAGPAEARERVTPPVLRKPELHSAEPAAATRIAPPTSPAPVVAAQTKPQPALAAEIRFLFVALMAAVILSFLAAPLGRLFMDNSGSDVPGTIALAVLALTTVLATVLFESLLVRYWRLLRRDDPAIPSAAKMVSLQFVPLWHFYWLFVVFRDLAAGLNRALARRQMKEQPWLPRLAPITAVLLGLTFSPLLGAVTLLSGMFLLGPPTLRITCDLIYHCWPGGRSLLLDLFDSTKWGHVAFATLYALPGAVCLLAMMFLARGAVTRLVEQ